LASLHDLLGILNPRTVMKVAVKTLFHNLYPQLPPNFTLN